MVDLEQQMRTLLADAVPAANPVEFDAVVTKVGQRRRTHALSAASAVVAVALAVGLPFALISGRGGSNRDSIGGAAVIRGARITTTIDLNPLAEQWFAAPPVHLGAILGGRRAYDVSSHTTAPIPAKLSYQIGMLTGDGYKSRLAWGFSYEQTCSAQPDSIAVGPPPSPEPDFACRQWSFVDARTGQRLEGVSQRLDTPRPGRTQSSTANDSNAQMISSGVLQVTIGTHPNPGDLTIQRMTAPDVLRRSVPQCVTNAVGANPDFFDLNWRSGSGQGTLPPVTLTLTVASKSNLLAELPDGTCASIRNYRIDAVAGSDQTVLQLFSRRSATGQSVTAYVDGTKTVVPLVKSCGDRPQPSSLSCTFSPVIYLPGSPFSRAVTVGG